ANSSHGYPIPGFATRPYSRTRIKARRKAPGSDATNKQHEPIRTNPMTTPNTIPQSMDLLEIAANHAESGARLHGVAAGLKHNLAAGIQTDKESVFGRRQ